MRIDGSVETVSVLVVIGVTEKGEKLVLALQAGDKESASNWRELFSDLKKRGLNGRNAILGIMDGLSGLEKVFSDIVGSASGGANSLQSHTSHPQKISGSPPFPPL